MNDYTIQISCPEPYPTCGCGCSLTWVFRPDSFHTEGMWRCNACDSWHSNLPHPEVKKIPVTVDQIDKGSLSFRTIFEGPVPPPPRKRKRYPTKKTNKCCRCGKAFKNSPRGREGLSSVDSAVFCTTECREAARDYGDRYRRKAKYLDELFTVPIKIQVGFDYGNPPRGEVFDPSHWSEYKWNGELNDFPY